MKKTFTMLFCILVLTKIYCAPIEVTSSNKAQYFGNNNKWNGPTNFPDGLILKGITGIIEDKTLQFGSSAKLLIENDGNTGAHIEIHGCTLKPSNGDYWLGVTLDGNSGVKQLDVTETNFNSEQSKLFILPFGTTRSRIEKAEIGIKVGSTKSKGGGVLRCTKTDFFDNMKSVIINEYDEANLSLFMSCVFKWTNFLIMHRTVDQWLLEDSDEDNNTTYGHVGDGIVDRQKRHVELNHVKGVTFLGGNLFMNEITYSEIVGTRDNNDLTTVCDCNGNDINVTNACRGVGIYSKKSSFVTLRGGRVFFQRTQLITYIIQTMVASNALELKMNFMV